MKPRLNLGAWRQLSGADGLEGALGAADEDVGST